MLYIAKVLITQVAVFTRQCYSFFQKTLDISKYSTRRCAQRENLVLGNVDIGVKLQRILRKVEGQINLRAGSRTELLALVYPLYFPLFPYLSFLLLVFQPPLIFLGKSLGYASFFLLIIYKRIINPPINILGKGYYYYYYT